MENKKQKSGIINTLAFVGILLLVIVVLYAVFTMVFGTSSEYGLTDGNEIGLEFTMKVPALDTSVYDITPDDTTDTVCSFLKVGDTFFVGDTAVGVVTAIGYEPCRVSTGKYDQEGSLIYAVYPDCLNLLVSVKTFARERTDGYYVAGKAVCENQSFVCSTRNFEMEATVQGVRVLSAEEYNQMKEAD